MCHTPHNLNATSQVPHCIFLPRLSHYALVELVVENEVAQNFLGKNDCASVQNICALKGFTSCPKCLCVLHFILQKKSPTKLESKTMVYLNIEKVACWSFVQQKNAHIPDPRPVLKKSIIRPSIFHQR